MLVQLTKLHPDLKFQYMGLDNNQASLERAMDNLGELRANVHVTLQNCDIKNVHPLDFEKFDMMIAIHTLTYMKSMAAALSRFVEFLN